MVKMIGCRRLISLKLARNDEHSLAQTTIAVMLRAKIAHLIFRYNVLAVAVSGFLPDLESL